MGGLNFSIHPLFFIFGLYYALTGRIFLFVICTATAVVHELGHSWVSAGAGYRLNKIKLMPFGAVVSGNVDGLKFSDEIKIALAGPVINVAIALFFVAMWWIYPECYAYTDVVVSSNLSMAIINLLPIYPLDGGRIIFAYLAGRLNYDKAFFISKIIGTVFALVLFGLFICTIFTEINVSLFFFSLFVLFGALSREKENKYVRLFSVVSKENLKRGAPYKKQAVHQDITVKKLIGLLDERAINEVVVFNDVEKTAVLSQERLEQIIQKADIYAPISNYL